MSQHKPFLLIGLSQVFAIVTETLLGCDETVRGIQEAAESERSQPEWYIPLFPSTETLLSTENKTILNVTTLHPIWTPEHKLPCF